MKTMLIAAAVGAALCLSAPMSVQAAGMAKGPTDVQIYCMFMPFAAKCTAPAKAAPAKPMVKKVAMAKPVAKPAAKTGIKMMSCVPAAKGAGHLYDCTWK